MSLAEITKALEILLVNFVLSGDNALVIAMATVRLRPSERRRAILYGTAASIILRIWLTTVAVRVLDFPYLQSLGGLLLTYLAVSLIFSANGDSSPSSKYHREPQRLLGAVLAISFADLTMSLDNVVALAGIAGGSQRTLIFGLVISISLIMFASGIIAAMLARYRFLQYLGAAVLAWTAGGMIGRDPGISQWFGAIPFIPMVLAVILVIIVYRLFQVFKTNE